jgi:hypothetical protein
VSEELVTNLLPQLYRKWSDRGSDLFRRWDVEADFRPKFGGNAVFLKGRTMKDGHSPTVTTISIPLPCAANATRMQREGNLSIAPQHGVVKTVEATSIYQDA